LFLPLVTLIYWRSPAWLRLPVLLIASYAFYMSWMKVYGLLLFGLTAVNYLFGLLVHKIQNRSKKRIVFIAGLSVNLFALVLFKYSNFLLDSFSALLQNMHASGLLSTPAECLHDLPIILPLGISFFVFEFIHYLTDVFKGDKPIDSPLKFALFAAFFPSQIAGPIKRYQDFVKQEVSNARFDRGLFWQGIMLIAQGMFKKIALGDNLAPIVQTGFANPHLMGTFDAWACVLAFSLQIYYDFSGYTDIAIGSAEVLGFRLPENFQMPYSATSLKDFWHRWHISLSTWLRDYLYIPLGGSRKGKTRSSVNLIATMLLGGLWHGASWHFVIWGGLHGAGLAINRMWDELIEQTAFLKNASKTFLFQQFSRLSIFIFVSLAWVVFRAKDAPEAFSVYYSLFSWQPSTTSEATITEMLCNSTLPLAFAMYVIAYQFQHSVWTKALAQKFSNFVVPVYARVVLLAGFALLIVGLAPHTAIPFIYFQF
jgi:D-alanyl-lipoteichoic acid acyltransferase DltB (MBOAT superfamily)